jgi:Protein of unknown function (DUF4054)
MLTVKQFRLDLAVFVDVVAYPDATVQFWLGIADQLLNDAIWNGIKDYAMELFVAHNLVIGAQNNRVVAAGGIPGQAGLGPVASKAVDGVSVSYDVGIGAVPDWNGFNTTTYGQQLAFLARMAGAAGSAQLGIGPLPPAGGLPPVAGAPLISTDIPSRSPT